MPPTIPFESVPDSVQPSIPRGRSPLALTSIVAEIDWSVDTPSQPTPRLLEGRSILFHRLVIARLQQSLNLMPFEQGFRCFRQSIHLLETLLAFAAWMPSPGN